MRRAITLLTAAALAACGAPEAPTQHGAAHICVDVTADAARRFALEADPGWIREAIPDLDQDGAPELALSERGSCGSGGCRWQLYASAHGCPTWIGDLFGQDITVDADIEDADIEDAEIVERSPTELPPLRAATCAGSCDCLESRYVFDGRAYRREAERDVRCVVLGDDEPGLRSAPEPGSWRRVRAP